ncbi:MAG: transposase [Desulfobacterales bacterium]|nr:transposase [Desulfobacterales bacterium]
MPRQSRVDASGALQHIIVRGIERRKIFNDDQDRYAFLERLGLILEQTGTQCFAWALIPNHFHLLLRTGEVSVATVMRRLLTGHAISYNRRHKRHGHLFQNRYKSVLCQEDPYFLELVRYIHLNPLRAKLIDNLDMLDKYPFSGHGVIMGKSDKSWQDCEAVLVFFNKKKGPARRSYKNFVSKGIEQGKRKDLIGGGLIRSAGSWAAVKTMRNAKIHEKSDERILGDGDFVSRILSKSNETLERQTALKVRGVDIDYIVEKVAVIMHMSENDIWMPGRTNQLVKARSLVCYWAVRDLGETMTSMARRFNISIVAVGKAVRRGADIVKEEGFKLL